MAVVFLNIGIDLIDMKLWIPAIIATCIACGFAAAPFYFLEKDIINMCKSEPAGSYGVLTKPEDVEQIEREKKEAKERKEKAERENKK